MRVSVLASGSNGNATCIKTTNESFLIDDGLSFKMLYARMEETNNDIHNLSSIFITHEHIDHVSGLKVLLKRKQLNCYLTRGTYEGLNSETKAIVAENNIIFIQSGDEILIDDCKITVIATHHDAKEPVGFVIEQLDNKLEENRLSSKLLLTIHDELVLEVSKGEEEIVEKIVIDAMKNAVELSIPLDVSYSFGKDLYEVK